MKLAKAAEFHVAPEMPGQTTGQHHVKPAAILNLPSIALQAAQTVARKLVIIPEAACAEGLVAVLAAVNFGAVSAAYTMVRCQRSNAATGGRRSAELGHLGEIGGCETTHLVVGNLGHESLERAQRRVLG